MKQHETRSEKTLSGITFYIRAFPGFTAARMSGELFAIISPAIAGLIPLAVSSGQSSALDIDLSTFIKALSVLNGDKVEELLKKLLTKHKNISVKTENGTELLDDELANEVFCGSAQDMYILAYEVIQVNFPGIFEKVKILFGNPKVAEAMEKIIQKNTAD